MPEATLEEHKTQAIFVGKFVHLTNNAVHMTKQLIIEKTLKAINQLPQDKAEEISDFADFIAQRYDEHLLVAGIQQLTSTSQTFDFLKEEEDLYSEADLNEFNNA